MGDGKKPKIRFPEFADDWEQRKLLDILIQPVSDGPHETPDLVEDGIPFISVDAIVDNKIDFDRKRGYITEEYDLECRKKYSPQRDDVYLVKSGATVGKVAIVETDERFNIWSPLAAMRTNKELMLPKYLYFYLQLKDTQDEIYKKSIGGTQPNLSMRVLEKFIIRVPHIEEQEKISDALSNLDNLITLHQRKLESTKKLKKTMLQKMFPKGGEYIPEVRFPEFTDAWEQRKLSDVSIVSTGYPFDSKDFSEDGDYLVITNGNIQNDFDTVDGTVGNRITVSDEKIITSYVLDIGDILVTMDGTVGRTAKVAEKKQILAQRVGRLKATIDSDFLYQWLNTGTFSKVMVGLSHGGTIKHISLEEIRSFEYPVPQSIEEQSKIGAFFTNIDNLITLHQRKCTELKNLKQFCLQNMFV